MQSPIRLGFPRSRSASPIEIAELEQAMMVAEFRTDSDYDEVRWAVETTNRAVGNVGRYGSLIS